MPFEEGTSGRHRGAEALMKLESVAVASVKSSLRLMSDLGTATDLACGCHHISDTAAKSQLQPEVLSSLQDFVQGVDIYCSRYTRVVSCLTRASRLPVALKIYEKAGMNDWQKRFAAKELELCKRLAKYNYPGLVCCMGAFEDSSGYYQALELCEEGDLYRALHAKGAPFSEEAVCSQVLVPLLNTLAFLHSIQIVHRDVKLENLLLSGGRLKLADLGLAVDLRQEQPKLRVGTTDYQAPEVSGQPNAAELRERGSEGVAAYDDKVDVWAAGVVAYELLVGHAPFFMPDAEDTGLLIREGNLPGFLGFLSHDCADFLQAALRKDPAERPTAEELLLHPWVQIHAAPAPASKAEAAAGKLPELGVPEPATSSSSQLSAGFRHVLAVATFASPNQSLSPRMGSWKIPTGTSCLEAATMPEPYLLSSDASSVPLRRHFSQLQEPEDGAEDIDSRAPGRSLSYVNAAPQLGTLREEVAESGSGGPQLPGTGAAGSVIPLPELPPPHLALLQLRRTGSAGKSRFA